MAILPVNTLRAKYLELSTAFIEEVNAGSIILSYPNLTILTPNQNNVNLDPNIFDAYGGRQPIDGMMDRLEESGTQQHEVPQTETIAARTYWKNATYDQNGNLIDTGNIVKTITSSDDITKINNAVFATIDGIKVKVQQPPIPYGLFGKQWAITFWETI